VDCIERPEILPGDDQGPSIGRRSFSATNMMSSHWTFLLQNDSALLLLLRMCFLHISPLLLYPAETWNNKNSKRNISP